jgi:hypothetical protein
MLNRKLVLVLAIQIHNLVSQSCLFHLLLEVIQGAQENIVIAIVES